MIIRQRKYEELEEIYNLIAEAFKTAKVSDGGEQDLAVILRNGHKYIKQLEMVCEIDQKLVGHIMLTHKKLVATSEKQIENALLLAPLSIAKEYRNFGVGAALAFAAISNAKRMGFKSVFLAGNLRYYKRFGFKKSTAFNITNINGIDDKFILALELEKNALENVSGTIDMYYD